MSIVLNGTAGITTPDLDTDGLTSNGIDDNATSTAMTLDGSGNLLVGTTSTHATLATASTLDGFAVGANSFTTIANDGRCLVLNRRSTDGNLLELNKNGTTVGSIGSAASGADFYVSGSGSASGVYFNANGVLPALGGSPSNGTEDLGQPDLRWKNLYLSGGVYLGGTGAANYLNDYEEGTWTPAIILGGLNVAQVYKAAYVKVGSSVHITAYFRVDGTGTTDVLRIGHLPFSSPSNGYSVGGIDFQVGGKAGAYNRITSSDNFLDVMYSGDSPSVSRYYIKGNQVGHGYVILSLTYSIA